MYIRSQDTLVHRNLLSCLRLTFVHDCADAGFPTLALLIPSTGILLAPCCSTTKDGELSSLAVLQAVFDEIIEMWDMVDLIDGGLVKTACWRMDRGIKGDSYDRINALLPLLQGFQGDS